MPFCLSGICCGGSSKHVCGDNGKPGILYALDFDQTILNEDSEAVFTTVLRGPIPDRIAEIYNGDNWAQFCEILINYCINKGASLNDIIRGIQKLEPLPGMLELMQRICNKNRFHKRHGINSQFIVISGSNDFFVKTFAESCDPPISFDEIISNHAEPTNDKPPHLKFIPYENQLSCPLCPTFLCKGRALRHYIHAKGPFKKVYYVGDGMNDICPAQSLSKTDTLFVRKDYELNNAINFGYYGGRRIDIKAKIIYFTDGHLIMKKMKLK